MKNQKALATAVFAVLAIGGLAATAASAQSYGGDSTSTATASEAGATDQGGIVLVQDTGDTETDAVETPDGTRNGRHGKRGGCDLDEAAQAIGIDEADLRAALDEGDTIADVATANGVDVETVIDAMVDAKADRLAEKVTEGRLTQAEADEKLADTEARITDRVNGVEEGVEA